METIITQKKNDFFVQYCFLTLEVTWLEIWTKKILWGLLVKLVKVGLSFVWAKNYCGQFRLKYIFYAPYIYVCKIQNWKKACNRNLLRTYARFYNRRFFIDYKGIKNFMVSFSDLTNLNLRVWVLDATQSLVHNLWWVIHSCNSSYY